MGETCRKPLSLEFFKERGFLRKKCPACGEYFWTLDPKRELCGEAPCEPYSFIGKGLAKKFSMDEAREAFLSFMESRGHTRVGRYPVLAKWRDDLFLTSASIVDFQPYVTAGLIPPPANPLVISQPCIRLKDMDKVGPTMGRHLTIFEMMAHHAFNTPDHEVYWMDRTVELFHEYATQVLGVKDEDIVYKEGFWEGGGNAGPDVEPMIAGLEVATLVFMNLKQTPEGYVEMENRIVDTGYGLERIVWLSQGTASAFEAVYEGLVDVFLNRLGVRKPGKELLESYSRLSSLMIGIEKGLKREDIRKEMARRLDMDPLELEREISGLEKVFAVLDHTKAISFMLADGAVPSNVQEGYLVRLLIRRSLKILSLLGAETPLSDLVALQIDYWGRSFPELMEARDRILEIVDLEEDRYHKTIEKGISLISRMVKRMKKEKRGEISADALIELYDSHGIPPEIVSKVASDLGVSVEIPENFYEMVAARHESTQPKPPEISPYVDRVDAYPKTKFLYYEDPYRLEFEANVLGVVDDAVILDKTAFYPEGGGQPSDIGYLLSDGAKFEITFVEKVKDRILHHVRANIEALKPGTVVKGVIQRERRLSLMRQHTATHLILASSKKVLGDHVWQWGAQKGAEESRLDISHYKSVSRQELRKIEEIANEAVMKNMEVRTFWLPRHEAERKYGFVIYQGGLVPGTTIRIVEIDEFNVQACGGTHVQRTGEVGPIKIWRAKRIQDGVVRLEFSAGSAAVKRLLSYYDELKELSEIFAKPPDQVVGAVKNLINEVKTLRKKLEAERSARLRVDIERALLGAEEVKGIKLVHVFTEISEQEPIIRTLDEVVNRMKESVVLIVSSGTERLLFLMAGDKAVDFGLHAGNILREVVKELGGGGGGSAKLGRGSVPPAVMPEEVADKIMRKAREALGEG